LPGPPSAGGSGQHLSATLPKVIPEGDAAKPDNDKQASGFGRAFGIPGKAGEGRTSKSASRDAESPQSLKKKPPG
jgi:hypothetical protein